MQFIGFVFYTLSTISFSKKDAFTRASLNEIAEKLVLDDPDKQTWAPLSVVFKPHHNSLTGKQRIKEKGWLQLQ
ncbi:hypothetical protein LWI28_020314 [Acer negundo]|uniref:Uncharacterized protein n=1 Tax=Acer negundo TaxID=4023 RepID=A0AAD5JPS8_ACENE|nr:hypothetical protein LWI28_020314 [Acer negundo]